MQRTRRRKLTINCITSSIALASAIVLINAMAASCQDGSTLKIPNRSGLANCPLTVPPHVADTLLVMPARDADKDETASVIREAHGTVVKTIGDGELTCYVVKVERGFLNDAERKLRADKHFNTIQRDWVCHAEQAAVNDPYFPSEWHLTALNVINGWQVSQGGRSVLAIVDTGTNYSVPEMSGKTYAGYDAIYKRDGQTDVQGHGTMVATTAAANTNNNLLTAAPARLSYVYPVRAGDANGSFTDSAVMEAVYHCGNKGVKILNLSANADPPYTFANVSVHSAVNQYFKWYHDTKGGLIFNSAGNTPRKDPNPLLPYLIVVSAINPSYTLASFSTYGNCVWFTAPGEQIYCSTRTGRVASAAGTSFSSPLAASIAALIWGAKPSLRNTEVENIMKSTCYKAGSSTWTQWYGYGMPNTQAALKAALGR
ncbi:MAG TPA: S8 family serine peptidase [Candidatus Obscuribacterales bacterium]